MGRIAGQPAGNGGIVGRTKDEVLRAAFAAEQDRVEVSLARRESDANVREFLAIMATAGAEPEPAFIRDPDAVGQDFVKAGQGWIISWAAAERGTGFLNLPFYGLMLMPDGTFRDFEAGTAEPLPYGALPSDFMSALGVGAFMLRLGGPAPAPDFSSSASLKSMAACARRYLELTR